MNPTDMDAVIAAVIASEQATRQGSASRGAQEEPGSKGSAGTSSSSSAAAGKGSGGKKRPAKEGKTFAPAAARCAPLPPRPVGRRDEREEEAPAQPLQEEEARPEPQSGVEDAARALLGPPDAAGEPVPQPQPAAAVSPSGAPGAGTEGREIPPAVAEWLKASMAREAANWLAAGLLQQGWPGFPAPGWGGELQGARDPPIPMPAGTGPQRVGTQTQAPQRGGKGGGLSKGKSRRPPASAMASTAAATAAAARPDSRHPPGPSARLLPHLATDCLQRDPSDEEDLGASDQEEESGQQPPSKRQRVLQQLQEGEEEAVSVYSSEGEEVDPLENSDREEGELSEEEPANTSETPRPSAKLFSMDDFAVLLKKAVRTLGLELPKSQQSQPDPDLPEISGEFFPDSQAETLEMPVPATLMRTIRDEWASPAMIKGQPSHAKKLYALPKKVMSKLQVPLIDAPVSELVSSAIFCRDGEETLKIPEDRRMDTALKRAHEALSLAIRASSTATMMARAARQWAKDALADTPRSQTRIRQDLNKLEKASAFLADSTLDSVQFCARAQAATVAARRQVWLKSWNADFKSKQNLVSSPFLGEKLFGESLEPVLVEDKDKKKKTLASARRREDRRPSKRYRPFRPSGGQQTPATGSSTNRPRDVKPSGARWGDNRYQKRNQRADAPKSSQNQTTKSNNRSHQ